MAFDNQKNERFVAALHVFITLIIIVGIYVVWQAVITLLEVKP